MTIHKDTKTLGSLEVTPWGRNLVEEMQDVLRLDELFGIADKHLSLAYERGYAAAKRESDVPNVSL